MGSRSFSSEVDLLGRGVFLMWHARFAYLRAACVCVCVCAMEGGRGRGARVRTRAKGGTCDRPVGAGGVRSRCGVVRGRVMGSRSFSSEVDLLGRGVFLMWHARLAYLRGVRVVACGVCVCEGGWTGARCERAYEWQKKCTKKWHAKSGTQRVARKVWHVRQDRSAGGR